MFSHEVNTGSSPEPEAGDTELEVTGRVFIPGNWYWPGICDKTINILYYSAICV